MPSTLHICNSFFLANEPSSCVTSCLRFIILCPTTLSYLIVILEIPIHINAFIMINMP